MKYQNSQSGCFIMPVFFIGILAGGYIFLSEGGFWPGSILVLIMSFCLLMFSSLTTTITDDKKLIIRYGGGVVQKAIHLEKVESCQAVRNPWFVGWGIRWFPGGWLYNICGYQAVELRMKNKRKYRIGTNKPQELAEAIQKELQ